MSSRTSQEKPVVACLFLVLFLGVADNQVISPLLPDIRAQFGKTSGELGLLFTGYSLAAGLSVLVWGPLSDIFGAKRGLLSGLLLFALGSAVSSLSGDYAALLSGRVVTGMGASMLSLNTIAYAAGFFPYHQRGWAMGSIVSSYFAALILGVPVGSWVGDRFGWHAVFVLAVATAAGMLAAIRLWLPGVAAVELRGGLWTFSERARNYAGFLQAGDTLGALLSSFFASAGAMGFLAFLGVWLHDSFGVGTRTIGLVFLASGLAALVASPLAGALSDRIGKKVQFVTSSCALALLLLLLPRLGWGSLLFFVFAAIGMAAAFRQGPMEALITELVAQDRRGTFIAMRNAFSQLGIGLAASASGLLFQARGYGAVCVLGCAANLASAGMMLWLLRRRQL